VTRKRVDARVIVVGGRPMVVLEPADYEALDAARRQSGGQRAQIRRLSSDLRRAGEQLRAARATLRDAIARVESEPCACSGRGECPRCLALAGLRTALATVDDSPEETEPPRADTDGLGAG